MEKKIVNLKRRTDRKERTENLFKNENVKNYEFVEAIDGKELVATRYIIDLFKGNNFGYKRGAVGCALSHYNLWKRLTDDSLDYYCIFEDDIELATNFRKSVV